jgi:hypothetical protein
VNAVAGAAILVMGVSAAAFAFAFSEGEHLLGRAWAVVFIVALAAFAVSLKR